MSLFPRLEALQLDLFGFAVRPPPVPKPAPTAAVRQRYIQLGQRIVAYTLRQGQRRQRVALRIDERTGLPLIRSPRPVTAEDVRALDDE